MGRPSQLIAFASIIALASCSASAQPESVTTVQANLGGTMQTEVEKSIAQTQSSSDTELPSQAAAGTLTEEDEALPCFEISMDPDEVWLDSDGNPVVCVSGFWTAAENSDGYSDRGVNVSTPNMQALDEFAAASNLCNSRGSEIVRLMGWQSGSVQPQAVGNPICLLTEDNGDGQFVARFGQFADPSDGVDDRFEKSELQINDTRESWILILASGAPVKAYAELSAGLPIEVEISEGTRDQLEAAMRIAVSASRR